MWNDENHWCFLFIVVMTHLYKTPFARCTLVKIVDGSVNWHTAYLSLSVIYPFLERFACFVALINCFNWVIHSLRLVFVFSFICGISTVPVVPNLSNSPRYLTRENWKASRTRSTITAFFRVIKFPLWCNIHTFLYNIAKNNYLNR